MKCRIQCNRFQFSPGGATCHLPPGCLRGRDTQTVRRFPDRALSFKMFGLASSEPRLVSPHYVPTQPPESPRRQNWPNSHRGQLRANTGPPGPQIPGPEELGGEGPPMLKPACPRATVREGTGVSCSKNRTGQTRRRPECKPAGCARHRASLSPRVSHTTRVQPGIYRGPGPAVVSQDAQKKFGLLRSACGAG